MLLIAETDIRIFYVGDLSQQGTRKARRGPQDVECTRKQLTT